jgi:hypothetical protein
MTKKWKKTYSWVTFYIFFYQKLQFTYFKASIKDAQTTREAFRSQNRTSSTSKHENSLLFLCLWVIYALLDTDPDQATQFNGDPDPQPWNFPPALL